MSEGSLGRGGLKISGEVPALRLTEAHFRTRVYDPPLNQVEVFWVAHWTHRILNNVAPGRVQTGKESFCDP